MHDRVGRDKRINSHDDYRCHKRCYLGKSNMIWEYLELQTNRKEIQKINFLVFCRHTVYVNKKKEIANIRVMYTLQKLPELKKEHIRGIYE